MCSTSKTSKLRNVSKIHSLMEELRQSIPEDINGVLGGSACVNKEVAEEEASSNLEL